MKVIHSQSSGRSDPLGQNVQTRFDVLHWRPLQSSPIEHTCFSPRGGLSISIPRCLYLFLSCGGCLECFCGLAYEKLLWLVWLETGGVAAVEGWYGWDQWRLRQSPLREAPSDAVLCKDKRRRYSHTYLNLDAWCFVRMRANSTTRSACGVSDSVKKVVDTAKLE